MKRTLTDITEMKKIILIDHGMIEINGKKYQPIKRDRIDPTMSNMMLMAMAFSFDPFTPIKTKEAPNIDIIKEFELIGQKKSKLSRSDREWVVSRFNSKFKEA